MSSPIEINVCCYHDVLQSVHELIMSVRETADAGEIGCIREELERQIRSVPLDDRRTVLDQALDWVWNKRNGIAALEAFQLNILDESLL